MTALRATADAAATAVRVIDVAYAPDAWVPVGEGVAVSVGTRPPEPGVGDADPAYTAHAFQLESIA